VWLYLHCFCSPPPLTLCTVAVASAKPEGGQFLVADPAPLDETEVQSQGLDKAGARVASHQVFLDIEFLKDGPSELSSRTTPGKAYSQAAFMPGLQWQRLWGLEQYGDSPLFQRLPVDRFWNRKLRVRNEGSVQGDRS
jgi:hypothetical protein